MAACTQNEAYSLISDLVGKQFRYGLKSPGIDFFDFGFGDDIEFTGWKGKIQKACAYAIHFYSVVRIFWSNGKSVEINNTSLPHTFNPEFQKLAGLTVQRVALSEKNDFWLDLGPCRLVIVTFEDNEESWRFFAPGQNEPHLIASDAWLQLDI